MENLYSVKNENTVLGAILLEPNSLLKVPFLKHKHFYNENNAEIFKEILYLDDNFFKIDYITVIDRLKRTNKLEKITPGYITKLTSKVASAQNIRYYAQSIVEDYIKRQTIIKFRSLEKDILEMVDISETLDKLEIFATEIRAETENELSSRIYDIALKYEKENKEKSENEISYKTGYRELDKNLSFSEGDLIIIAGGPSHGKTAFALNIARNLAINNIPLCFFSLEMTDTELTNRIISNEYSINNSSFKHKLTTSQLDKYNKATAQIKKYPIFVSDKTGITWTNIKSELSIYIKKHNVKVAIIDYLQLISATNNKQIREQQIAEITRNLKIIAKQLKIPIILLSQLNRSFDTQNRKPKLSDLRESGAIEQDADAVILTYNYDKMKIEIDENGNNVKGLITIMIEKNRGGRCFETNLSFNGDYQRISEIYEAENNEFVNEFETEQYF